MEWCNQCRFYLEPSFQTIDVNSESWVDNGENYPDQILPSNIMYLAMNHPHRLVLSIYFMELLIHAFNKLVKGEERW